LNPRPLFTPAAEKAKRKNGEGKGLYDPALEGWSHSFLYDTFTPSGFTAVPTLAPATGVGPTNLQSSVQSGDGETVRIASARVRVATGEVSAAAADMLGSLLETSTLVPMPTPTPTDKGPWSSLQGAVESMRSRLHALN